MVWVIYELLCKICLIILYYSYAVSSTEGLQQHVFKVINTIYIIIIRSPIVKLFVTALLLNIWWWDTLQLPLLQTSLCHHV